MSIQRYVHVFHNEDAMKQHVVPPDFPESPERLSAVMKRLRDTDCIFHKVGAVRRSFFVKQYGSESVAEWEANCKNSRSGEDEDVVWSRGTLDAVRVASNAAISAVHKVFSDPGSHAFCAIRPPGHHCFLIPAGFCIVNNVAVAAKTALELGKRVAIIDWDYHFGDGTARTFLDDSRVFFASLHCFRNGRDEKTYPHTYLKGMMLSSLTKGRMFNIQWLSDDADNAAYAYAFQTVLLPALRSFAPDIILISAGYDSLEGDALAGMRLTPSIFRELSAALTTLGLPIVCVMEGGYSPDLLAEGVYETVQGLLYGVSNRLEDIGRTVLPHHKAVVDTVLFS